jgi:outer membrane protein assembly factor BamB
MNWASARAAVTASIPEKWALIGRDAFSGVLLWKRPLSGFGQFQFEDVGPSQPTLWNTWASPLQLHRRVVARGDRVFATLAYRGGLTALDAATGETVWEYEPRGFVDEIISDGARLFVRLRANIPSKLDKPIGRDTKFGGKYGPERFTQYIDEQPPEKVVAVDAATGREIWTADAPRVTTESLCALAGKVCYFDMTAVVCRDAATGRELWRSQQPKLVFGASYARSGNAGNLFLWQDRAFFNAKGTVCLSLQDGKELWRQPRLGYSGGFGHPTGLRLIDGVLYTDNGSRYDANTGSDLRPLTSETAMGSTHGRCHRGVATTRFLCGIRFGIEFYDLAAKKMVSDDRWLRSACALGYIPANGLLYHTPDPCACWLGARIRGFHALGPQAPAIEHDKVNEAERLEKGPAYSHSPPSEIRNPQSDDWPLYRHDIPRSGQAKTALGVDLKPVWCTPLGGKLTPPIVAAGRVYVSRQDANEVVCLDAGSGKVLWRCGAPSYVDSPPTMAGQRLVFGCADGRVYCLRATDGALVWRFRVAPAEMMIVDDTRVASKWPVHGSVLVKDGIAYCIAGRSSYLDGGIQVVKLEVATGRLLGHARFDGPWHDLLKVNPIVPKEKSGKTGHTQSVREGYYPAWIDIEGARSDLLVSDGTDFHMGSMRITPNLEGFSSVRLAAQGKPTGGRRLRSLTGLLDDTYYHRTGWHYSDQYYGAGNAAGAANAGKILVFDDQHTYASQHEGQDAGRYPNHLPGKGSTLNADPVGAANVHKGFGVTRKDKPLWTVAVPQIVRAMLLAPAAQPADGKLLFIAGPIEAGHPKDPLAPYEYRTPGSLWALSANDGKRLAEWTLGACPVFDGLAAAGGKLFISQVNGQVVCLGTEQQPQKGK